MLWEVVVVVVERYHNGWEGAIKRRCGIHEDLETLWKATSSKWSKSMIPGWIWNCGYNWFTSLPWFS